MKKEEMMLKATQMLAKPDIPWDDVQDEAAQNFDVR